MTCVPNFRSLGWFSFSSAVNSFWQLLTADDSCHNFFWWDLHLPPKADTCAKFQLSRLIFIFISCQQLLTAVDSWWQLSQNFFWWDLHLPPKADTCAKFQLSRLLGGSARECDRRTDTRTDVQTHIRQVKIELTQPCLDGDRAWVGQYQFQKTIKEIPVFIPAHKKYHVCRIGQFTHRIQTFLIDVTAIRFLRLVLLI